MSCHMSRDRWINVNRALHFSVDWYDELDDSNPLKEIYTKMYEVEDP